MQSRAAIAFESRQPLEIGTIEVAPPRSGEVLVEVAATGVCHTDAVMLDGENPRAPFPAVLGHEGAGVVVERGPDVTGVQAGDHVIPLYCPECGECAHCRSHRTNICWGIRDTRDRGVMPDGTSRLTYGDAAIHHFMGTSTFSNYTVVPEVALAKVRKDAPLDRVCLLGCAVTTGVGAALNDANIRPGDTVAVFGLGAVGLNAVQGARLAGAERVIGIDINPAKAAVARELGATDFIDPKDVDGRVVACVSDMTNGGVDAAIECAGGVNVMEDALNACRVGWGTCVLTGVEGKGEEMAVPPGLLRYGRSLKGSYFGSVRSRSELPGYVDMYMNNQIAIDPLVSHEVSLDEINDAFDKMRSGAATRSVVRF